MRTDVEFLLKVEVLIEQEKLKKLIITLLVSYFTHIYQFVIVSDLSYSSHTI